jgi:hypothetical protein
LCHHVLVVPPKIIRTDPIGPGTAIRGGLGFDSRRYSRLSLWVSKRQQLLIYCIGPFFSIVDLFM